MRAITASNGERLGALPCCLKLSQCSEAFSRHVGGLNFNQKGVREWAHNKQSFGMPRYPSFDCCAEDPVPYVGRNAKIACLGTIVVTSVM